MMTPMFAATVEALVLGKAIVRIVVKKLDAHASHNRLKRDYDRLARLDNAQLVALGLTDEEIRGVRRALYADYAALSWG